MVMPRMAPATVVAHPPPWRGEAGWRSGNMVKLNPSDRVRYRQLGASWELAGHCKG